MSLADSICDNTSRFATSTPLSQITNEEYNIINQVLQRNFHLKQFESFRLRKMSDEIIMELNREKLFEKNKNLNDTNCIRCLSAFYLILNPKRKCVVCNYNICKKCSQIIKNKMNKLNGRQKNYICYVCFKQKIFETSFWFNENLSYKLSDTLDDLSYKFSSISSARSSKRSLYDYELSKYRTADHDAFIYENFNALPQDSSSSSILSSKDESANELDYEYILKKYENNTIIRKDLNNFKSKLKNTIKDLINGLDELATINKNTQYEQDEYDELIYSTRNSLKMIIQNIKQNIKKELIDLKESKSNRITLFLVVNEIERCVKTRSGKILKEIESFNEFETNLAKLEDQLASLIIRKYLSKRKFTSLVDLLTKHVDYDQEYETNMLKLKKLGKSHRSHRREESNNEQEELSYKSISSSSKSQKSSKKLLNSSKSNENLILSLNSLINKNDEEKTEKDFEAVSSGEKSETDWQENWSFIGKDVKPKALDEVYASIDQFTSNNSPVILTVPEPKEKVFPQIQEIEDDKVSDATLQDKFSPEHSLNNDNIDKEKTDNEKTDIEKTDNETSDQELKEAEESKFPIPKNILINRKKLAKSSSYYRQNDERLESETETESVSNKSSRNQKDDINRITPKEEIVDPKFDLRPSDRLIRFGETVKFVSKVHGSKPLEVFWYKMNGDELQNNEKYEIYHDDEFHYLKIFNTLESDSGMYLCVISNDKDQNIDSFCLTLRDNNREFRVPQFFLEMEDIEIEEGYSATFKVKVDFGYPKARILFYKNGELILNDHRHEIYYCGEGVYHLHLPNVTDEDNSQYTCVAINNGGRVECNAELYVLEKENVKRPDMLLKLQSSSFKTLNNSIETSKSNYSIGNMEKTMTKKEQSITINNELGEQEKQTESETESNFNSTKNLFSPIKQEFEETETHQTNCSLSMTSYEIWNENVNNQNEQQKDSEMEHQFISYKETVNNYLTDDLTQLTITSHIDKLNSSFNKIVEENESSTPTKTENILENIDENLKIFKQSANTSANNLVQTNTASSILNAINLEKRNSLLLSQPPEIPVQIKETDDTNYEETNFTFTEKFDADKNVSEIDVTQDKDNDFTYISVNNEILEKVEAIPCEAVPFEPPRTEPELEPVVVAEPIKSSLTSKDIIENEYKEFKIEPVKKLKKLWESQMLPNLEPSVSVSKVLKHSFSDIKPAKKWSSMQSINQKEKHSSKNSLVSECSDDARTNMNNVLDEIKRFDFSRSQQSLDKYGEIHKAKKSSSNDNLQSNELDTKIVEKLKHKFDNKDHCFTKIASLTCRNVLNKDQPNNKSNNSASHRPMLSLYENQVEDMREKPKMARLIKSESANNLQSICSSSSSTNQGFNNLYRNPQNNETKLRKTNSLSTYSISSSVGSRSSSSATCESMNTSLTHRNNIITSQQSFNKEIKGLLDIAENRTKQLCKVYDSSINDHETGVQIVKEEIIIRRPILMNKNRYSLQNPMFDHSKITDYRGIINSNYLKSNKKQSNVIQKVKMWDQMVETGRLMTDKWDNEFIQK